MREYLSLGWILVALFSLLSIGAIFSPTYTQQIGYIEALLLGANVLFIVSAAILVGTVGVQSLAFYVLVLSGLALVAFGPMGSVLVLGISYAAWGWIFAVQVLLAYQKVPSAIAWLRDHNICQTFQLEFRLFVPILWLLYLLLEWIPHWADRKPIMRFDSHIIRKKLTAILPTPC